MLTKRQFLGFLGSAIAASFAAGWSSWPSLFGDWAMPVDAGDQELLPDPLEVPRDFVGMHAHRWPVGEPVSAAPTYGFGAARSHDFDGAAWCDVHLGPGRFRWERLDRWVEAHAAAKRTLVYTLSGTPAWAADSTLRTDLYGRMGGGAPPKELSSVAAFVEALVSRYNGEGERRIAFLETWNEPDFRLDGKGFWWGTAGQLASLGRAVFGAAKQADSGLKVLSPGFAGNLAGSLRLDAPSIESAGSSSLYQYLTAPDGGGGTGRNWCEGIAFHCYDAPMQGANRSFVTEIRRMQAMLKLMGVRLPLYETELGFLPADPFHRLTKQGQGTALRRLAALHAALGVQGIYFYSHDDDFVGDPSAHPEVAQALDEMHALLAGRKLLQVTLLRGGGVRVKSSEQTFVW